MLGNVEDAAQGTQPDLRDGGGLFARFSLFVLFGSVDFSWEVELGGIFTVLISSGLRSWCVLFRPWLRFVSGEGRLRRRA